MGWDGAAYLGLLADDHTLQTTRVLEAQALGDSGRTGGGGGGGIIITIQQTGKRWAEGMQVVTDLVDGAFLGFGQVPVTVKGVLLEEEADLVAAGEEIVVADVVGTVLAAGGEFS